jgi:hypothetical protein
MHRLAGVLATLALLLVGCGGTTGTGAGAAEIVPADAPAFVAFNTDPESSQWQTVDELASRFPDKEKAVKFVKDSLREEGADWDQDVKPALGPEFALVWLDFGNDGENFVGLMQPDDEEAFERIAKKERDDEFVYEKFRDWYVLADNRSLIERFRQKRDSGGSLADKDAFKDAMDSYPEDSLFRAYVNGETVMEVARRDADPNFRKYLDKLGSLDWIAADLRVTSEGIRFDATVHGTAGPALKGVTPTRPFRSALQHEIPRDALVYATFHGAKGMLAGLENNPVFGSAPELRRYSNVLRRVGSLLQGENAIYVRPGAGKIPEVTLITEPAPGTNGAATLDRILARYRSQLELPSLPRSARVAGVPARVLDFGIVKVYYADVGKRFVVTDLPAGIKALKGTAPSLAQSQEYKGALESAGMPAKTQGFFYVNVSGGISYAERLAGSPVTGQIKRNLRPLRSAVEYALTRPSEVQVTFFLRIK